MLFSSLTSDIIRYLHGKNFKMKTISLFAAVFFLSVSTFAATFNVNTTADTQDAAPGNGVCADSNSQCSFRAALTESNALAGQDTINLPAGIYTQSLVAANENVNAGGDWDINSAGTENNGVTITGAGRDLTFLQASVGERVIENLTQGSSGLGSGVSISGVTIRFGRAVATADAATGQGGGVRNAGSLTITNADVRSNNASLSGGIHNEKNITLDNVNVVSNTCSTNFFECLGGGMYNQLQVNSAVIIRNSSFTENVARVILSDPGFSIGGGLGIESNGGALIRISDTVIADNFAQADGFGGTLGGGLFVASQGGHMQLEMARVTSARNRIKDGVFHHGTGIFVSTNTGGSISGFMDRVISTENSASYGGGLLLLAGAGSITMGIFNSTFSGNGAIYGGGIGISGNSESAGSQLNVNMINSTISGNVGLASGGGIHVDRGGAGSVIVNANFCTISKNEAAFDSNGSTGGGGIFTSSSTSINLKNSVVSGNIMLSSASTSNDILGTVNSQNYNHIGILTGAIINGTTTNNTTGNAMLGALTDNGGLTRTHQPLAGSPLIDSIPNGANDCGTNVTQDQRSTVLRPQGAGCDRGSVEATNVGPWTISGTVRTAGGLPVRNAIVVLTGDNLPEPLTFATATFGLYEFTGLPPGHYTLTINSKKYTFDPRQLNLQQNELSFDLTASGKDARLKR